MTTTELIALLERVQTKLRASELRTRVHTRLLASELLTRAHMWAELTDVIANLREEELP